jgi:hypothetical protein
VIEEESLVIIRLAHGTHAAILGIAIYWRVTTGRV